MSAGIFLGRLALGALGEGIDATITLTASYHQNFWGLLQPQGNPASQAAQPSPELVPLDGDPLPVEHHHQPAGRARGIEPLIDLGLQPPEDLVHLLPPAGQEAFPADQRLGLVLELARIACPHVATTGLGLEARHSGERIDQLQAGPAGDAFQQRAQVGLLGREQRRPLLRFDADERPEGHGQARQEVAVLPEQGRRVGRGRDPHDALRTPTRTGAGLRLPAS